MGADSLRIAHIDTERTWRGGEQQVFSLVEHLSRHGHQNLIIGRSSSALSQRLKAISQEVFEVCPWGEWDLWAAHLVNRKIRRRRIDVVHAHTAHGVALAALATLGTKIPIIGTRRVDFHLERNFFSQWKHERTSQFLAISKKVKEVLMSDGIPERKISLVPSGIDFSRFKNVSKASLSEMGFPPGTLIVGQVAALAPHKAQDDFLKAVAILKDKIPQLGVVMVGEGECRKDLEALAEELGISGQVKFLGFREDALRFLAAFDVFCLSSCDEGLGTSLLDAMALRVPIVATRTGGIPEIIEDGKTGYLSPPHQPTQLAEVLSKAIEEKNGNHEILEQAYKKALHFDVNNTVTLTEAAYYLVLGKERTG